MFKLKIMIFWFGCTNFCLVDIFFSKLSLVLIASTFFEIDMFSLRTSRHYSQSVVLPFSAHIVHHLHHHLLQTFTMVKANMTTLRMRKTLEEDQDTDELFNNFTKKIERRTRVEGKLSGLIALCLI